MILYEVSIGGGEIRERKAVKECPKSYKIFIGFGIYRLVLKQSTNKYKIVAQTIYDNYFITCEDAANYCEIKKEEREQRSTIMKEEQEYLKNREKVIAKAKIDGAREFVEILKNKPQNKIQKKIYTGVGCLPKVTDLGGIYTESYIDKLLNDYTEEIEK